MTVALPPRVVIGATHSGAGKTTVSTGIMAALSARGVRVAPAKVGPDFIDPGYHALATGRPGRNLDAWICGAAAVGPLAGRAGAGADLLVIEGVMGLFDGAAEPDGADIDAASTAHVARLLDAPVILVVDAAAAARSVAATVFGFTRYDPRVRVAGVVFNRVGSDGHEALLREAVAPLGTPVLGALRRDEEFTWRDRHLGLVPVAEGRDAVVRSLRRLGAAVAEQVDLEAVVAIARAAPPMTVDALPAARPAAGGRVRVALATGPAFSFTYPDNLEALTAAGAEIVAFDPCHEPALPDGVDGLYAGGGFPEVFAARLASNRPLLADAAARIASGLPTVAECGGLLWLARSLDGHPMAGAVPADARMTDRLTLGYRRARLRGPNPIGAPGTTMRGHEFHYSVTDPAGHAVELSGRFGHGTAGFATPTLIASYLHLHFGADPAPAERFVAACRTFRLRR